MKTIKLFPLSYTFKKFLQRIKDGTSIPIDSDLLSDFSDHVDSEGRPLCFTIVDVNKETVVLLMTSNGSYRNPKVIALDILCESDNAIPAAKVMRSEIRSLFPSFPLTLKNLEGESIGDDYLYIVR